MAKFEKFNPKEHIRGLALAAVVLLAEQQQTEERNFQECMEFFRQKAQEMAKMQAEVEQLVRIK